MIFVSNDSLLWNNITLFLKIHSDNTPYNGKFYSYILIVITGIFRLISTFFFTFPFFDSVRLDTFSIFISSF